MSGPELIARLARLNARDRAWLLAELPTSMRHELLTLLGDESRPKAAPAAKPAGGWEALDPQQLALQLDAEPAWLVSAATRGTDPKWRERLLHAMSSRRRHDIELADRSEPELDRLLPEVVRGLAEMGVVTGPEQLRFARARRIDFAYVIFDHAYYDALAVIEPFLAEHRVISAGRYGKWTYCSMEDAILMGRKAAKEAAHLVGAP